MALLSRHELASTSLSDTRKTIGTRKVSLTKEQPNKSFIDTRHHSN